MRQTRSGTMVLFKTSSQLSATCRGTWNFGDGATTNLPHSTFHLYRETGTYTVSHTVGTSTANIDIIIIGGDPDFPDNPDFPDFPDNPSSCNLTTADFGISILGTSGVCCVRFQLPTSPNNQCSGSWRFGNGDTSNAVQGRSYCYGEPGQYTVTHCVDGIGCTSKTICLNACGPYDCEGVGGDDDDDGGSGDDDGDNECEVNASFAQISCSHHSSLCPTCLSFNGVGACLTNSCISWTVTSPTAPSASGTGINFTFNGWCGHTYDVCVTATSSDGECSDTSCQNSE